jgi:hypothetical protein
MERTVKLYKIDENKWHPAHIEMTERRGWEITVITVGGDRQRAFLAADASNLEMQGVIARHDLAPVIFRGKDLVGLKDVLDSPRPARAFDSVDDVGFDCTTDAIKDNIRNGRTSKALVMMGSPPSIDWISLTFMHAFSVNVRASGIVTIRDKNEYNALPSEQRFDDMVKTVLGHVARMVPVARRWRRP